MSDLLDTKTYEGRVETEEELKAIKELGLDKEPTIRELEDFEVNLPLAERVPSHFDSLEKLESHEIVAESTYRRVLSYFSILIFKLGIECKLWLMFFKRKKERK